MWKAAFLSMVLFVVFQLAGHVAAAPVSPTNPIEIRTEIGAVAGMSEKTVVTLRALVTKKSIEFTTEITSHEGLTFQRFHLSPPALAAFTKALAAALEKPDADSDVGFDSYRLLSSEIGGKRVLTLRDKAEELFGPNTLSWDTDNATTLLALAKKSAGLQEWLKEKAVPLQGK